MKKFEKALCWLGRKIHLYMKMYKLKQERSLHVESTYIHTQGQKNKKSGNWNRKTGKNQNMLNYETKMMQLNIMYRRLLPSCLTGGRAKQLPWILQSHQEYWSRRLLLTSISYPWQGNPTAYSSKPSNALGRKMFMPSYNSNYASPMVLASIIA